MPRKSKGIHTSPKTSGVSNMPKNYEETHHDDLNTVAKILPIYSIGQKNRQDYEGKWDEETLSKCVSDFFQYCSDNEVKPCKAGLRLWLGISKSQYWEWENYPAKYGFKSKLLEDANALMEFTYVGRLESYPTGNMFLLKASHGYTETTKVEVNGNQTSTADVADAISKLGLDK